MNLADVAARLGVVGAPRDLGYRLDGVLGGPPAVELDVVASREAEVNDVRTLRAEFDEHGERFKPWRLACQDCSALNRAVATIPRRSSLCPSSW